MKHQKLKTLNGNIMHMLLLEIHDDILGLF
jgi:hypothetical protein